MMPSPLLSLSCPYLQAEQADYLGGFLLLQSMAGGTGAGLGTYVAEAIRDTFPSAFLMNHCIWSDLQQNSVATFLKSADTMLSFMLGVLQCLSFCATFHDTKCQSLCTSCLCCLTYGSIVGTHTLWSSCSHVYITVQVCNTQTGILNREFLV